MGAKLLLFLSPLLSLSYASALGAQNAQALARGVADPGQPSTPLVPRDECKRNNCACKKVPQGQYCALCQSSTGFIVTKRGSDVSSNHVYECNENGACCDYGRAEDCARGTNMRCGSGRQDYFFPVVVGTLCFSPAKRISPLMGSTSLCNVGASSWLSFRLRAISPSWSQKWPWHRVSLSVGLLRSQMPTPVARCVSELAVDAAEFN